MRSHPCCTSITQDDVKPWRPFVSARLTHMPGTRWCPTEAALKPDHKKARSCNSAKIEHANFHSFRCNPTWTCLYLWGDRQVVSLRLQTDLLCLWRNFTTHTRLVKQQSACVCQFEKKNMAKKIGNGKIEIKGRNQLWKQGKHWKCCQYWILK